MLVYKFKKGIYISKKMSSCEGNYINFPSNPKNESESGDDKLMVCRAEVGDEPSTEDENLVDEPPKKQVRRRGRPKPKAKPPIMEETESEEMDEVDESKKTKKGNRKSKTEIQKIQKKKSARKSRVKRKLMHLIKSLYQSSDLLIPAVIIRAVRERDPSIITGSIRNQIKVFRFFEKNSPLEILGAFYQTFRAHEEFKYVITMFFTEWYINNIFNNIDINNLE